MADVRVTTAGDTRVTAAADTRVATTTTGSSAATALIGGSLVSVTVLRGSLVQ